jgi:hypothetical protein
MIDRLTHHFEFDVADDKVGAVARFLVEVRAENIIQQANGATRKKGDAPKKMNGASIREVILAAVSSRTDMDAIRKAVASAGYSPVSASTYLGELVSSKMIRRVDRGVYSIHKALPAPAKKKDA